MNVWQTVDLSVTRLFVSTEKKFDLFIVNYIKFNVFFFLLISSNSVVHILYYDDATNVIF